MQELNLKLTISELNLILEALGSQPYLRVYELIADIQNQAQEQLNGSASGAGLGQVTERPEASAEITSN